MNYFKDAVAPGFGERLRIERERLGMSQEEMAAIFGVKRLAQSQYEKEVTAPTVRYLAEIAKNGVDLHFLIFGIKINKLPNTAEIREKEKQIFHLIEEFAARSPDKNLSADARYVLYDILRNKLLHEESNAHDLTNVDFNELLKKDA